MIAVVTCTVTKMIAVMTAVPCTDPRAVRSPIYPAGGPSSQRHARPIARAWTEAKPPALTSSRSRSSLLSNHPTSPRPSAPNPEDPPARGVPLPRFCPNAGCRSRLQLQPEAQASRGLAAPARIEIPSAVWFRSPCSGGPPASVSVRPYRDASPSPRRRPWPVDWRVRYGSCTRRSAR